MRESRDNLSTPKYFTKINDRQTSLIEANRCQTNPNWSDSTLQTSLLVLELSSPVHMTYCRTRFDSDSLKAVKIVTENDCYQRNLL